MGMQWIKRCAILGCALLAFSIGQSMTQAQEPAAQPDHQQTKVVTLEGPAIHVLVTEPLSHRELRKLAIDPRSAREHPDLAAYYEGKARRLQADAEDCQQIASNFGDPKPLAAPDHFNIGRNARHYHVIARRFLRQSQSADLLAALYTQAAQGEGCFTCHSLNGRGGTVAPDLAMEGTRGRSNAWLIGHFKDPQAYSPASVMPSFAGLTHRQLQVLATFLQNQKER
jgi:mono/diheme cytochrome c family protein